MNRLLFATAFILGAIAVFWMGSRFVGSDALALTVTVVIGCVYTIGFIELLQFRQATSTLSSALSAIPKKVVEKVPEKAPGNMALLDEWLDKLHPSLQNSVRLRIEGERVGLPAPVITPYLVGLLVMLGLLGTFVGMVETLKGAVFALEGTTELQAIRAGLAAPIKGLSLAFGTSVAGVATSAMLGLISTLCRRDRMLATRRLDSKIATVFREFSLTHNRQETYKALQTQASALPEVAQKLCDMADKLERMGDSLGDKLIASQDSFHESVKSIYTELATSVDKSLRHSLAESGRLAGESIKPLVQDAMTAISKEAHNTQQQLSLTTQQQLETLSGRFTDTSKEVAGAWQAGLAAHEQANEALVAGMGTSFDAFSGQFERTTIAMLETFDKASSSWVERMAGLETTVASNLATLGQGLEEPMTRLIETASETPRAAAEVIGHLRREISNNIERDNSLLEERSRIMAELNAFSGSLQQASVDQREAIENLVNSSATLLQDVGAHFSEQVGSELAKVSGVTDNFAGSATQLSSLGDAFGLAVTLFNESNGNLIEHLTRIEDSMDKSTSRSDEQMGYYVAQAREIIDQSILSQREVFDELRQLSQREDLIPAEAG